MFVYFWDRGSLNCLLCWYSAGSPGWPQTHGTPSTLDSITPSTDVGHQAWLRTLKFNKFFMEFAHPYKATESSNDNESQAPVKALLSLCGHDSQDHRLLTANPVLGHWFLLITRIRIRPQLSLLLQNTFTVVLNIPTGLPHPEGSLLPRLHKCYLNRFSFTHTHQEDQQSTAV